MQHLKRLRPFVEFIGRWIVGCRLRSQPLVLLMSILSIWLMLPGAFYGSAAALSSEIQGERPDQELIDQVPILPDTTPQTTDASDIPSETISQFVRAYLDVVDLVEKREVDLQRAETEAESLQIQREIQAEAFQLIESAGLTRRQYWQLLGLANIDPDFREQVLAQVEEASL